MELLLYPSHLSWWWRHGFQYWENLLEMANPFQQPDFLMPRMSHPGATLYTDIRIDMVMTTTKVSLFLMNC
jgi:hypothetical protein